MQLSKQEKRVLGASGVQRTFSQAIHFALGEAQGQVQSVFPWATEPGGGREPWSLASQFPSASAGFSLSALVQGPRRVEGLGELCPGEEEEARLVSSSRILFRPY